MNTKVEVYFLLLPRLPIIQCRFFLFFVCLFLKTMVRVGGGKGKEKRGEEGLKDKGERELKKS